MLTEEREAERLPARLVRISQTPEEHKAGLQALLAFPGSFSQSDGKGWGWGRF